MDIQQIKQYIENELSKGNKKPYRELRNLYFYFYRNLNRQKIRDINNRHKEKIREKKKRYNISKEKPKEDIIYPKNDELDIFK